MSEYHDTNEDERDWVAHHQGLRNEGADIARELIGLPDAAIDRIRQTIVDRTGSCAHTLAGFDSIPTKYNDRTTVLSLVDSFMRGPFGNRNVTKAEMELRLFKINSNVRFAGYALAILAAQRGN